MRALDVPQYVAVGILESLWNLTARETPAGNIGKLSNEDIALQIDWRENPDTLIQGLFASGWIDVDEQLRYYVHDWHEHADDAVDNALARSGKCYANGQLPRMKRLSDKEKAALVDKFRAQKPTSAHSVRTESHKKPLPCLALPEPVPKSVVPREPEPPPEGIVEQIVCAHPKSVARNLQPNEVRQADAVAALEAIEAECEATGVGANEASAALLEIMHGFAEKIPRGQWRYLKDPAEFFRCRDYRRNPEEFMREGGNGGANSGNRGRPFDPGINTAPQPTEDEIEKIRAIIEAKQAALIAEGKIPPMRKVLQRAGDCRT